MHTFFQKATPLFFTSLPHTDDFELYRLPHFALLHPVHGQLFGMFGVDKQLIWLEPKWLRCRANHAFENPPRPCASGRVGGVSDLQRAAEFILNVAVASGLLGVSLVPII